MWLSDIVIIYMQRQTADAIANSCDEYTAKKLGAHLAPSSRQSLAFVTF
jgi:hypothetical protein